MRKKGKWYHPVIWAVVIVVVAFLALATVTPALLSSDWGTDLLIGLTNRNIPGKLRIRDMELRWFGDQVLLGLELRDPEDNFLFSADALYIQASLWSLLWGSTDLGRVELTNPHLYLELSDEFGSNLERSLRRSKQPHLARITHSLTDDSTQLEGFELPFVPPVAQAAVNPTKPSLTRRGRTTLYTGVYHIADGILEVEGPGIDPILLTDLHAVVRLPKSLQDVSLQAHGYSQVGDLSGEFSASLHNAQIDSAGDKTVFVPLHDFHAVVQANNFPLGAIDVALFLADNQAAGLCAALAGPVVNGKIIIEGDWNQGSMHGIADTQNIDAKLQAKAEGGRLGLTNPATCSIHMTPEVSRIFFPKLPRGQRIELAEPATLAIEVTQLDSRWYTNPPQLADLTLEATANLSATRLRYPSLNDLSITSGVAKASLVQAGAPLEFAAALNVQHDGQEGDITCEGSIVDPLHRQSKTWFSTQVHDWPTSWFLPIVQKKRIIEKLVGSYFSMSVEGQIQKAKNQCIVAINSDYLQINPTTFSLNSGTAQLINPTNIQYNLTPKTWEMVFSNGNQLQLDQAVDVQFALSALQVPLIAPFDPDAATLAATLSTSPWAFSGLPHQNEMMIHELRLNLSGESLANGDFATIFQVHFLEKERLWATALGSTFPVSLQGEYHVNRDFSFEFDHTFLSIQSALLSMTTEFSLLESGDELVLHTPLSVEYLITPQLVAKTPIGTRPESVQLERAFPLTMEIEPFDIDLASFNIWHAELEGNAAFEAAHFTGPYNPSVYQFRAEFSLNDPFNTLTSSFSAATTTDQKTTQGQLKGELELEQFHRHGRPNFNQASLSATLDVNALPCGILELTLQQTGLLPLVGPVISASFEAELSRVVPPKGDVLAKVSSEHLNGRGDFHLDHYLNLTHKRRPAQLSWTITPKGYTSLKRNFDHVPSQFNLTEATVLEGILHAIRWPLTPEASLAKGELNAHVDTTPITIEGEVVRDQATIEGLSASLAASSLADPIELYIKGTLLPEKQTAGDVGQFVFDSSITNLFTDDNQTQLANHILRIEAVWKELSILWTAGILLDHYALATWTEAIFGPTTSGQAHLELQQGVGSTSLNFSSQLASAELDGRIQEGFLTLNQPLTASIVVTPQLGKAVLEEINPIFTSTLRSNQRATLTIEPDGFAWPLSPFRTEEAAIARGTLDLGILSVENQGALQLLMGLFDQKSFFTRQEVTAWTTPVYFSISEGKFDYERTDVLLGQNVELASWGHLNLLNGRVRATIGIPGTTLRRLLNNDSISPDTYLLLPVRGAIDKVDVNWKKSAARLAAIIAKSKGSELLGGAVETLTGKPEKVPPPTTNPLPWEKSNANRSS